MEQQYYIICKRHGYRKDFAVLFWGSSFSGYTYDINCAGTYTQAQIDDFVKTAHKCDDAPVVKSLVDEMAESYVIDNTKLGLICRNTPESRRRLDIKLNELHTGNTNWDYRAFCEPKLFLYKTKNVASIIEQIKACEVSHV